MSELYKNPHVSQYALGASNRLRRMGCTPTSGANGANASTGGRLHPSGDDVLAKVKQSEETDPATPGWSLFDLDKAMTRLGVPFEIRSGNGWAGVVAAHNSRHYVVLQGDSDRFGNQTCSGAFDGNHCIGVHPDELAGKWRIDDPICKVFRFESPQTLRAYAEKLYPKVYFGVFTNPVPVALPDTSEEPMEPFSIPQAPSIAEAVRDTKLYQRSDLTGSSYPIAAGATKRLIGNPQGDKTVLIIGHDRSPDVDGKSALYGRAADWKVQVSP